MTAFILPIIMVLAAGGLFFGYIGPAYDGVMEKRAEEKQYRDALNRFEELTKTRDRLSSAYQQFPESDKAKLRAVLPDNLDNIRFALDLDNIAQKNNIKLLTLALESEEEGGGRKGGTPTSESTEPMALGSTLLTFDIEGTYKNMITFLTDVEKNVRLVDLVGFTYQGGTGEVETLPVYSVSVRLYWLK